MNHLQYEQYKQIDESYRQRMVAELQAEKLVQQYRAYHPRMFEKAMFKLAIWMISVGKRLYRRYEIPATSCAQTTSRHPI
jgi:hypothetical protein